MARQIGSIETDAPRNCPVWLQLEVTNSRPLPEGLFVVKRGENARGEAVERMACEGAWYKILGGFSSKLYKPCRRCALLDG